MDGSTVAGHAISGSITSREIMSFFRLSARGIRRK
jgi:hypothetical protein